MADAEHKGLVLRLEAAERDRDAWKETALVEQKDVGLLREQIVALRHERNLFKRERAAIWRVVREIGPEGDIGPLLDLLAALASPLREGEGLLEGDDDGRDRP